MGNYIARAPSSSVSKCTFSLHLFLIELISSYGMNMTPIFFCLHNLRIWFSCCLRWVLLLSFFKSRRCSIKKKKFLPCGGFWYPIFMVFETIFNILWFKELMKDGAVQLDDFKIIKLFLFSLYLCLNLPFFMKNI